MSGRDDILGHAIKRHILTCEKFGLMQYASAHLDVSIVRDVISNDLAIRLATELLTDKIASDTYTGRTRTNFPATPWQHFKQRHEDSWWLRWFVRRFPVGLAVYYAGYSVTWDKRATYPDARIMLPDTLGQHVVLETVTGRQTYVTGRQTYNDEATR